MDSRLSKKGVYSNKGEKGDKNSQLPTLAHLDLDDAILRRKAYSSKIRRTRLSKPDVLTMGGGFNAFSISLKQTK